MPTSTLRLNVLVFLMFTFMFATASRAHAAQQDSTPIVRKSGDFLTQSATKRVEPTYPPLAKAARVSGSVIVEVTTGEDGKVVSARALSGHPLLKDSAVAAARQWEFTPTLLRGEVIRVIGTITFNYIIPEVTKALEDALENVRNNPQSPGTHEELAKAYIDADRLEEAIKAYEEAIRLQPDFNERLYLGLASAHSRHGNKAKQKEVYEKGLQVFPASVVLLKSLGDYQEESDSLEEALAVYQRALALAPASMDLLVRAGTILYRLSRYQESLNLLLPVVEKLPSIAPAHELIGTAQLQLGNLDEAEKHLKKSLALEEYSESAWESLGDVYQRKGNTNAAVQAWRQALKTSADDKHTKRIMEKLKAHLK